MASHHPHRLQHPLFNEAIFFDYNKKENPPNEGFSSSFRRLAGMVCFHTLAPLALRHHFSMAVP